VAYARVPLRTVTPPHSETLAIRRNLAGERAERSHGPRRRRLGRPREARWPSTRTLEID